MLQEQNIITDATVVAEGINAWASAALAVVTLMTALGFAVWKRRKRKEKPPGVAYIAAGESTMCRTKAKGEYLNASPVSYISEASEHTCIASLAEGGEESSVTLAKLRRAIKKTPASAVIVATGINDILEGVYESQTLHNIATMRALCDAYGKAFILLQIPMCPGFSPEQKAMAERINAATKSLRFHHTNEDFADSYHLRLDRYFLIGNTFINALDGL